MKATIIGAGNTGFACAADLARHHITTTVYSRDPAKAAKLTENPFAITGRFTTTQPLNVSSDLAASIQSADVIIVATWANVHTTVIDALRPLIHRGQAIIFLNGNWGLLQAVAAFTPAWLAEKRGSILETSGMPYVAQWQDHSLHISEIKAKVTVSTYGAKEASIKGINLLKQLYAQVIESPNILQASLSALNPIIHVPVSLFNLSRIEHAASFHILTDGLSSAARAYIMHIDDERKHLASALHIPYSSIVHQLATQWGTDFDTLREVFHGLPTYRDLPAPDSLQSRFIVEDLPFGIDPLVKLGEVLDVSLPYSEKLAAFAHAVFDQVPEPDLGFINAETIAAVQGTGSA
ncbi:NAD/NADP octopine/nopaline dehydrogenase family protein [Lacticaseibacillus paracasei]|nr:NAD/NADP octopine/nopaline dehydrogenase family protein [Lacticaseibacillus paracasei]URW91832.1 NAD/NADP octopine/nopaline dehydrogenase family protein [Lacticaseibacillus paracasei]